MPSCIVFVLIALSHICRPGLFVQCFFSRTENCDHRNKLEVLPGLGWDSLRGKEMAPVFIFNYKNCKQTSDREFVIPDEVIVSPVRKSKLTISSELIKHWSNYTDISARSVELGIGLGFENVPLLSISGSFSSGYTNMKREQLKHSGYMTRTSVRHEIYHVQMAPEAAIAPELKRRLDKVIDYQIKDNGTEFIKCILEFTIRDYGTHYIKAVEAGGILYTQDFVNDKIISDKKGNEDLFKVAAKADFASRIKLLGASYGDSDDRIMLNDFSKYLISREENSIGGELLKVGESANDWTKTVVKKLGTIDRFGEPLFMLLTATHFPDIEEKVLQKVGILMKSTIEDYYRHNAHEGCMDIGAPNFNPMANINNGQCKNPLHSYKFGGIFKQCKREGYGYHSTSDPECDKRIGKKNPITGKMACPDGYEEIKLFSAKQEVETKFRQCEQKCTGMWFWKKCIDVCHDEPNVQVYNYDTYWCGAKADVTKETGYMFGGILTSKNDLQQCPNHFYELELTVNIKVCVSNDYSLGYKNSVSFGGFFSCSANNPIANGRKGCPESYEQILVGLIEECEVKYCVRRHVQESNIQDIALVLPPYKSLFLDVMNPDPKQCFKNEEVKTTTTPAPHYDITESPAFKLCLMVLGVAMALLLLTLCYFKRRSLKNALTFTYSGMKGYVLIPTSNGYKASKEFLTTNVAEPTGEFLSTKVIIPSAAMSTVAYESSKNLMSRAWINTKYGTSNYVYIPVTDACKSGFEYTKRYVVEPMKTKLIKMKSQCFRRNDFQEQLEVLSNDDDDVELILDEPKSVNLFPSSEPQICIDIESNDDSKNQTNRGFEILAFYNSDILT